MITVRLNKTLQVTCSAVPAQSKHLLNTSLSYYPSDLVTLPLNLPWLPVAFGPAFAFLSGPIGLTLGFLSWVLAKLNILTTRDWPASCWGGLASSPRFWNCSELGMHR